MKCQECGALITVDGVGSFCSVDCYSKAFSQQQQKQQQPKPVKVGSLVKYLDAKGGVHTALVLGVKPNDVLQLKVFRIAQPNHELEARPAQWRRGP